MTYDDVAEVKALLQQMVTLLERIADYLDLIECHTLATSRFLAVAEAREQPPAPDLP